MRTLKTTILLTLVIGIISFASAFSYRSWPTQQLGTNCTAKIVETAQAASVNFGIGVEIPGETNAGSGYSAYIEGIYSFAIKLGGLLTALMLIYAGYRYMTSQGNPSAINEAKDIMIGSLSGFALLLLVTLVRKFVGLN